MWEVGIWEKEWKDASTNYTKLVVQIYTFNKYKQFYQKIGSNKLIEQPLEQDE